MQEMFVLIILLKLISLSNIILSVILKLKSMIMIIKIFKIKQRENKISIF